jgi:WD40 repeat protein
LQRHLFILTIVFLVACTPQAGVTPDPPTIAPTTTLAPAASPSAQATLPPSPVPPSPTSAPTTAPTSAPTTAPTTGPASLPFSGATPTPTFPEQPLTSANVSGIQPLRTIGFGRAHSSALANDDLLGVATARGVAWFRLPELTHLRFDDEPGGARALARSPDGTRHAFEVSDLLEVVRLARTNNGGVIADLKGYRPRFSPDGRYVSTSIFNFSGTTSGQLFIWSAQAGRQLATLDITDDQTIFSPDSSEIVTPVGNNVAIWSLPDGQRVREMPGRTAAYSPDGNTLAVGTDNGVQLYERRDGRFVEGGILGSGEVSRLAFMPDGQRLAAHVRFQSLIVWEVASGQELVNTGEVYGEITQFNAVGSLFAAAQIGGDAPPMLKIYRVSDGSSIYTDQGFEGGSASFNPAGDRVAVTYVDGDVKVFAADGTRIGEQRLAGYERVAFSPDGRQMAACRSSLASAVDLWQVVDGTFLQRLELPDSFFNPCNWLTYNPAGTEIVAGFEQRALGSYLLGYFAQSWEIAGSTTERVWQVEFAGTEEPGVPEPLDQRTAYSPATETVAWLDENDVPFLQYIGLLPQKLGGTSAGLAYSPDGSRIALLERGSLLTLVQTTALTNTLQIPLASDAAGALSFSPDGSKIALFQLDGRLSVWDTAGALQWEITGAPAGNESPGSPNQLLWSPDGQLVITGTTAGLGFYQASDGSEAHRVDTEVYRMAIGPAGRILAIVGFDGRIVFWGIR